MDERLNSTIKTVLDEVKIKLIPTDKNKDTGTQSDDVVYLPDFESLYGYLNRANEEVNDIIAGKGLADNERVLVNADPKLKKFQAVINSLFNEYRTHLRTNYPNEYEQVKNKISNNPKWKTTDK